MLKTHRKPLLVSLLTLALSIGFFAYTKSDAYFFATTHQHPVNLETASDTFDTTKQIAYFRGKEIQVPMPKPIEPQALAVLGGSSRGDKRIEVNLTEQNLYAFEGNKRMFKFPISSGMPWAQTPTGTFYPWIKLRYTSMIGGSQELGTYYNLPNVPYTMYFYNDEISKTKGYGLHGAYWHNNFGNPMSHGCVNAPIDQMGELFEWAELDTPITIYGQTPGV